MNVSIQDGWNIGWKLGHVLDGRAPEALLSTYSDERMVVAQDLIDFDKEWSTLMATPAADLPDPSFLEDFYVKTFEFPAGFMTQYAHSAIVAEPIHQELALGYPIGKRFRSSMVNRVADTVPVELGHHARADGRWRIYVFADASDVGTGPVNDLADWLIQDVVSPVRAHTPSHLDIDAYFDLKVIYQQRFEDVDHLLAPDAFRPRSGKFKLVDWEKVYATDANHDIFDERSISRDGAIVVVRPDQYVANVLPLSAHAELANFFGRIFQTRNEPSLRA
jgi:phenol 2-monooxygenase